MRTLGHAARKRRDTGAFLPDIFQPLANAGIRLREGGVSVIAGTPGSMKTGLTLYWVGRLGIPAFYWSADSEDFEIVERMAAAKTGATMLEVRSNPEKFAAELDDIPIRFSFEDSPTYNDLALDLGAYAEVMGEWPRIIVLDNLLNLVGETEDEWSSHREHMRVVHKLARITKASILVLAHMGEDKVDPSGKPAPRTKLQGKVSHLPKVILSLAFDGQRLKVAAVKNRFGPASPSGENYVELWCDPTRNQFFNSQTDWQAGRPA